MSSIETRSLLLLLAGSVSTSLLFPSTSNSYNNIILPERIRNENIRGTTQDAQKLPSVTVTSVYNETQGSRVHPFACWEHPAFFSTQKKKWDGKSKQTFEINCWTRSIQQTTNSKTYNPLQCSDNEIYWFQYPKENCWLPDYVVLKNAPYGPPPTMGSGNPWGAFAWLFGPPGGGGPPPPKPGGGGPPPGGMCGPPPLGPPPGPPPGPNQDNDLRYQLRYCPPPIHQVGSFRDQYNGQTFCYRCTRLDCENRKISHGSNKNIDLSCYTTGNKVEEDPTWWKLKSDDCYIPNQVFEPTFFQGNAVQCVKK